MAEAPAEVGSDVHAIGWGYTENGATELPTRLRQLDTTVIEDERCLVGGEWDVDEGDFCTSPEPESGLCGGDSGSPGLQWINGRWELVGVVSRGVGDDCATQPDVFPSAPEHAEWINGTING
jgi:hypothetical protein